MTRTVLISAAGVLLMIEGANAQETLTERVDRQLQQLQRESRLIPNPDIPPAVRSSFDYGVYLTANFIQVDEAQIRRRRLQQYDITGYARFSLDNTHDFFVRGVSSYRDEKPFGDPDQEGWDSRIERLYYRFDLGQAIAGSRGAPPQGGLAVQVGRDLQYWGTGLTLATDLDAVTLDFTWENRLGLRLLAGMTPHDSTDIDDSRPGFIDDTQRSFYGALVSAKIDNHRPFAYVLVQRDHNPGNIVAQNAELPGAAEDQTVVTAFDYNSVYWAIGSTGALTDQLAYGVELVYESGTTLSRNPAADRSSTQNFQTKDDISAFAANAQLDYLFGDERNTRLGGAFIYASGDTDRLHPTNTFAGNTPGTHDRGFNAFGQLNTGLAFSPEVSNLMLVRVGGSTFPFTGPELLSKMQVGVDLFGFFKARSEGPVDEASTDNAYLGFEPDIYVNWQITTDVTLAVRYGVLFPGEGLAENDDERHAIFMSMTFGF